MTDESPDPPILVVCLLGPTGTGKSELALRLAQDFPVEIVSVDSAMVYRRMDVGTAKPAAADRARVPHHLIDIREPWEPYSAGRFVEDASSAIRDIDSRGRVPLLAGGTLLYFRALFRGLAPLPPANDEVRSRIEAEARERGWPALHGDLAVSDPAAAARIKPADRQRIQRALEVFRLTGRPLSELQEERCTTPHFRFFRIALLPSDRQELYRRLERRVTHMLLSGLVAEIQQLMALPLMSAASPAMRSVGYRQFWRHVAGEVSLADAERATATATRRLAKRQMTWLRTEPVELAVDAMAEDAPRRVADALRAAGVSRLNERCNMIEQPLECREYGV